MKKLHMNAIDRKFWYTRKETYVILPPVYSQLMSWKEWPQSLDHFKFTKTFGCIKQTTLFSITYISISIILYIL